MAIDRVRHRDRIRVVHVLHTMDYGGVETIVINWLRALDPSRVEARVACFANPGNTERLFVEAASRAGIPVLMLPWHRGKPIFRSAAALTRILAELQADVVHTHNTYADVVGLIAAKRLRLKTVSSLYVWSDFGWKRNILQWINQIVLRFFDVVTAQCDKTLHDSVQRGLGRSRLLVLPSGYEMPKVFFTPAERLRLRRENGIEDGHILLANFSRYYPEKAQDILLREFRVLVDRYPSLRLWLVGRGPDEARLRDLLRELHLEPFATMKEFTPQPERLAQCADIQVHPSHAEGIPMALLMGMSLGLPIVASSVGGIAEVIEDGQSGLLVPAAGEPDFSERFRSAVSGLVDDEGRRRQLGASARRFIENQYSLENAASKLEDLYAELVAS